MASEDTPSPRGRASSRPIGRQDVLRSLTHRPGVIERYREQVVGRPGLAALIKYDLVTLLAGAVPGAMGCLLRARLLPLLMDRVEPGVFWGRRITLRRPAPMRIGRNAVIHDDCLLDAGESEPGQFSVGADVTIGPGCTIQSVLRGGFIEIGDGTRIGAHCTISSAGGVRIGSHVLLGEQCHVGGARYHADRLDVPMARQGAYAEGVVEIADDVWLGPGVRVLDGVTIGTGAVVGAGSVVTRPVPAHIIAAGVPAREIGTR